MSENYEGPRKCPECREYSIEMTDYNVCPYCGHVLNVDELIALLDELSGYRQKYNNLRSEIKKKDKAGTKGQDKKENRRAFNKRHRELVNQLREGKLTEVQFIEEQKKNERKYGIYDYRGV